MIVITTPAGDIGARVLDRILDAGERVRVIARNPAKLRDVLCDRVDVIEGSHADPAAIERALEGATRVFWLPPGNPTETSAEAAYVGFSRAFAEALPHSNVTHVVGISALGRGWPKPAGLVSASLTMDDMIGATGVGYRALTCASLMDNLLRQVDPIRESGLFFAPTPGDLALPHVAKADVANLAANLLLQPTWQGVEEIPLYGPEDISHNTMAKVMSDVLAKPVRFQEMPMNQFEAMLESFGTSAGMVRDYAAMMSAKNEGMDTVTRPISRTNTRTKFRKWCERELAPIFAE